MTTATISARLKAIREQRRLSQEEVSRLFGFKDRQTLSAIETGERRLSAEELVRAVEIFGVPLDFFTDPFLLVGEGKFSWRQTGIIGRGLVEYERDAGRMIAAFRMLAPQVGKAAPLLRRALGLSKDSSFEDASAAGERFAAEFRLGDVPAARLAEIMEQELGMLVLMVDPIEGASGAACRLPELDVVLINRREVPGRRHFDLAHELFHILTWDAMPPDHVEDVVPKRRNRVEQLADNFASAVLMPSDVLSRYGDWSKLEGEELVTRLNMAADELRVTASALRWRLVGLGWIGKGLAEDRLRNNGRAKPAEERLPHLFSKSFVEVIAKATQEGRVAIRRVSYLLGLSIDDLAELFMVHGVEAPYEL
ncbi:MULTISPECIES: helix-turn-helix domain-containing protein [unclassified Mesorhizobium]|uniref:helix-turn-helix domain-containing protein n=1 Tax=unclassified Mesorhizobium TaxID=325217 RepID=UPI0015E2F14C|nr:MULTISPECIES: XRE family transcriptional regulator [unclassified Mesorhizobium]MBZ9696467.1 XRE family transcriptional regulator [Mesorhizobium sp. CO1-1-9]